MMGFVIEHDDLALAGTEGAQDTGRNHVRRLLERVGDLRLTSA
jgi:hypothetical protein